MALYWQNAKEFSSRNTSHCCSDTTRTVNYVKNSKQIIQTHHIFLKQVPYHTTQYFKYGRKTHVKFNLEVMVTLKGQLKTIEIKIYHT